MEDAIVWYWLTLLAERIIKNISFFLKVTGKSSVVGGIKGGIKEGFLSTEQQVFAEVDMPDNLR